MSADGVFEFSIIAVAEGKQMSKDERREVIGVMGDAAMEKIRELGYMAGVTATDNTDRQDG